MKFWLRWVILGLFLVQSSKAAQDPSGPSGAGDRLPFRLSNGYLILVEGRIGSLPRAKFLLDIGTSTTVVDEGIAKSLSLKLHRGKRVLNLDSVVKVESASLPEIQLGPLRVQDLPVRVSRLKQFSEFTDGVDAIVGLDLLAASDGLRIDYSTKQITVRTTDLRGERKTTPPPALTVRLYLQNQPARLVIGMGVQSMLLYKDRIRKHLSQLKFDDKISCVYKGRLACESATVSGIRVGDQEWQLPVLLFASAPGSLPADVDGYLGTSALGANVIDLDFASNTIQWE
jgi:hypothetical protein